MAKYIVKVRDLSPAQRNPYRPSQKIKRGPWRTFRKHSTWAEAKVDCERQHRGFKEAAIFVGKKIHRPNEFTGKLPETEPTE